MAINKVSKINTITTSFGESMSRSTFNSRITRAKDEFTELFLEEHGFYYCEECGANQSGCPGISRSHIVSVDECIKRGFPEYAYDIKNFYMHGQKCHIIHECKSQAEKWEILENRIFG